MANPNPVPKPENLRPWKPGESGNRPGYSKRRRATSALIDLIERTNADEAIAKVWLKAILEGDFRFFREYLDRTEGPVTASANDGGNDATPSAPHRIPEDDPRYMEGGEHAAMEGVSDPDPTP